MHVSFSAAELCRSPLQVLHEVSIYTCVQWNLSIMDKLVQVLFVHYMEMSFYREVISIIAF